MSMRMPSLHAGWFCTTAGYPQASEEELHPTNWSPVGKPVVSGMCRGASIVSLLYKVWDC